MSLYQPPHFISIPLSIICWETQNTGAQRRGERPTVDIASDLIHEEYPFWSHWKEKDASAECSDNDNSPVERTAAADDFHAECTDNPPVINIDPKNPPMAVAVPMER